MPPEILIGPLRISQLRPTDAQALFNYRSDAEVARFQSWLPQSIDDVHGLIARTVSTPFNQNDSWKQLAVRWAATDELIGDLGVHFLADGRQVEIGFTISPPHQRQGHGMLAVAALLDHLFTILNKHRVCASVDPGNEASLALLRSVGMRQEAHFRQSLFWKEQWVDDVVFAILRSEWKGLPPSAHS